MSGISSLEETLQKVFSPRGEIAFAYLFGSQAQGREGPLSDIDIAVYLEKPEQVKSGTFGYRAELSQILERRLGKRVDVVILNHATLLLSFQVLKNGRLIFCRSEKLRFLFHYRVQREYLDIQPLREVQNFYLQRRMREGNLGGTHRG